MKISASSLHPTHFEQPSKYFQDVYIHVYIRQFWIYASFEYSKIKLTVEKLYRNFRLHTGETPLMHAQSHQ